MKLLTGLLTFFIASAALAVSDPPLPPTIVATNTLLTNSAPIIKLAPVSQIITQGNTSKFTVSANLPSGLKGPKPKLRYQWSVRSVGGTTTNIITTATNSTLIIPTTQYTNQGQYIVTVSYVGSQPSSIMATLTVPTTNILSGCITNNKSLPIRWDYNLLGDPAVNLFKLRYGLASNLLTSTQYVSAPNLLTTISNLLSQTYYVQATAVNTNGGESLPSNQLIYNFGLGCSGVPFTIDIMMLTNNTPRLTTKLCPNCSVTVYRSTNLTTWTVIGATSADQYGNIIFDDHNAPANYGFYRMSTTP